MQELRLIPARKLRATLSILERAGWCGMLNEERPPLWMQVSDWIDRNGPITNSRLREMSALDTLAASKQLKQWTMTSSACRWSPTTGASMDGSMGGRLKTGAT